MIDKQTLVLIPGLLCDHALYAHQISHLSDVARIMVADTLSDDSVEGMATRLLDSLEGPFALAGLSMGGYVAQQVMRQAPDRVTRLALLDTNARADRDDQIAGRKAQMALAQAGRFDEVVGGLAPMLVHEDRTADAGFMARVVDMMTRVGPEVFVRQQTAIMSRPDGREDLTRISVPTLCLCGREDALTPPKVHIEMTDRLCDGYMVAVENCGHMATMEQPEAVTAVLRYWLQVG